VARSIDQSNQSHGERRRARSLELRARGYRDALGLLHSDTVRVLGLGLVHSDRSIALRHLDIVVVSSASNGLERAHLLGDVEAASANPLGGVDAPQRERGLVATDQVLVRRGKVHEVVVGVADEEGLVEAQELAVVANLPTKLNQSYTHIHRRHEYDRKQSRTGIRVSCAHPRQESTQRAYSRRRA